MNENLTISVGKQHVCLRGVSISLCTLLLGWVCFLFDSILELGCSHVL